MVSRQNSSAVLGFKSGISSGSSLSDREYEQAHEWEPLSNATARLAVEARHIHRQNESLTMPTLNGPSIKGSSTAGNKTESVPITMRTKRRDCTPNEDRPDKKRKVETLQRQEWNHGKRQSPSTRILVVASISKSSATQISSLLLVMWVSRVAQTRPGKSKNINNQSRRIGRSLPNHACEQ
jgi:hypothetical protein